jgi:hypothetical protein
VTNQSYPPVRRDQLPTSAFDLSAQAKGPSDRMMRVSMSTHLGFQKYLPILETELPKTGMQNRRDRVIIKPANLVITETILQRILPTNAPY